MKLKFYYLIAVFTFLCGHHAIAVVTPASVEGVTAQQQEQAAAFEAKIEGLSAKKQTKWHKRITKLKDKIHAKLAKSAKKMSASEARADGGISIGLIILLVGVLIAILGFAGIGDILVTIGLVVLVVGLILWLIGRI